MNSFSFFATCPKGLSDLLAAELRDCGAGEIVERAGGVHFQGSLEVAYRACLWSRTANRILLRLAEFEARSADDLYAGVSNIDWSLHLAPAGTLACEFTGSQSPIAHTHHAALRMKDAVVDQFRNRTGERPSIDTTSPDVGLFVHAHRDTATLYIDLSGESLHRRGYRIEGTPAPLKENLAAGILLRAGWPRLMKEGAAFLDPMCGSGTFVIEAALIARDIAPGFLRQRFGFSQWLQHDEALWQRLKQEVDRRREQAQPYAGSIRGFDVDGSAVRVALGNADRAGLRGFVHIERREIAGADRGGSERGLLCVNPPYGERLSDEESVRLLYQKLGQRLREEFVGWEAAALIANPQLGREIGILAKRSHTIWNGPIECRLLRFQIEARRFESGEKPQGALLRDPEGARARPGAQQFANRLGKNYKAIGKWARKEGVRCFRVYDADMPEYNFAIDLYQGAEGDENSRWLSVQEYAPPKTVDPEKARARRDEALSAMPEVFGIGLDRIFPRTRRRAKGGGQYGKRDSQGDFHTVEEGGLKFLVNFTDYIDTGLFLDHRPARALVRELAKGQRFLNLFGYTGTASVSAAAGGARTTTTVDLSNTYLEWAQRNLELNGFKWPDHRLVRADCLKWLQEQVDLKEGGPRFGLIFLDPPTFSNSKKMEGVLDTQRDHVRLIGQAAQLLTPKGVLIFSTNYRRFKLDEAALPELKIEDISAQSIPQDFQRHADIHQTYRLSWG